MITNCYFPIAILCCLASLAQTARAPGPVDADGNPQELRVVRGINEVLDQKALEAVAKFRFKPAMKGKQQVPVRMTIEVNFRY